jgi:hypothetical protein
VDEFPIHGFAGLLLPLGDGFFGIALREGDSEKRKRFTIAHELGHFCIPSHRDRAALCVAPDLSQDGSNKLAEREASEFAAELLMPRRVIESIVATGSIDIARALTISARFNVSLVSAAIRMCELSRQAAAVAYFSGGTLAWTYRYGLAYGLPDTGTTPPERTLAHDVINGGVGAAAATVVDPKDWLPLAGSGTRVAELLESSIRLEGEGEALTVLWATDPDELSDDTDEL